MFLKVLSVLEKTQGNWIALDLKTQGWSRTLQESVRYLAAGIKHDPLTNHISVTFAGISLQAPLGLLTTGLSGKGADTIVLSGSGFFGTIHNLQIQQQDVLELELYNGFCGACDFDVACWNANIYLGGSKEDVKIIGYNIRY